MGWRTTYFESDDYLLLEGEPNVDSVRRVATMVADALGLEPDRRVLELGCGLGHVAAELADRGYRVTAVDGSEAMVEQAKAHAADRPTLRVEQYAFHALPFEEAFDAVISLGHSIGHDAREDDARAVARMVAALVPGGRLLLELQNPVWYRENAVGRTWWVEGDHFVLSEVDYEEQTHRLRTRDIIIPPDGGPHREYGVAILCYEPEEIGALLSRAGLVEIGFHGSPGTEAGGPSHVLANLTDDAQVMIVTARKR